MILDRKWSRKSTANDPQRKIGMACTQVSGWSCQFYYYYKTSELKRNFTAQINTWIKTIWKKSFKCKQATHVLPECCLFQWIFSPMGRFMLWRKTFLLSKCDLCRLYFILRGHDTHIDFLRLLFLVGMIALWCKSISFDLFWNAMLFLAAK